MLNQPPPIVHVQPGDTTSQIADRIGVSNAELVRANTHKEVITWNGLEVFAELEEGEYLNIPSRVASQFLLENFPPPGFAAPSMMPLVDPSTASPCKPGEVQLSPGVCIPGSKGPVPQGGCGAGYRAVMGQCVPDPQQQQQYPKPPCGPDAVEIMGRCVPKKAPAGQTSPAECKPGEMPIAPGVCVPTTLPNGSTPQKPTSGGCPEGTINVLGQCIPDPTKQQPGTSSSKPCGEGTMQVYPGLCVPVGAQPGSTSGSGCPDGSTQITPGLCLPPGVAPSTKSGGCGEGRIEVAPGVCIPSPSGGQSGAPPVPCPEQWSTVFNGLCAPPGAAPGQGGDQPPCGAGYQQLAPGICIPVSVPTNANQGGCGAGRIEIVPGVCIPDPKGNGVPVDNTAPTAAECAEAYGAGVFPYRDPATGLWGCGSCGMEFEEYDGAGFCRCKQGFVRKDPNDPTSPCVAPTDALDKPTAIPQTQAERDLVCQDAYGPNSTAVFFNGQWQCNVCRPDEEVDSDGFCVCLGGTHRAVDGDPNSACIPITEESNTKKSSSDTLIIAGAVGVGALMLLGIGILSGQAGANAPTPRDEDDEEGPVSSSMPPSR